MTVRILLADDHKILRQGLTPLLNAERDFQVIGEASSGLETLKKVDALRPDVLVLDLSMPDLNGLEVIRLLEGHHHKPGIVILTMFDKAAYVNEALKHGNCSYVLKGEDSSQLIEAIRLSASGSRYLSPTINSDELERYQQQAESQELNPYETLTNREREIFHLVIEGYINQEIADHLQISRRTVEKHREHLMDKLHVKTHGELVWFAVENGFTTLRDDLE